jgi:hypothetical protein
MSPTDQTAAYFDQDQSFILVEIAGADMFFQTISRTGKTVDSGVIHRQPKVGETGWKRDEDQRGKQVALSSGREDKHDR